jgi:hypothetical protein
MPSTNVNYKVACFHAGGELDHIMDFATEHDAKVWIAKHADSAFEFLLYGYYELAGGSLQLRLISLCGV